MFYAEILAQVKYLKILPDNNRLSFIQIRMISRYYWKILMAGPNFYQGKIAYYVLQNESK